MPAVTVFRLTLSVFFLLRLLRRLLLLVSGLGKYYQCMRLLPQIAGEVFGALTEMFDYYLYAVFMTFFLEGAHDLVWDDEMLVPDARFVDLVAYVRPSALAVCMYVCARAYIVVQVDALTDILLGLVSDFEYSTCYPNTR